MAPQRRYSSSRKGSKRKPSSYKYIKNKYQDPPRKSDFYYFVERNLFSFRFWKGTAFVAWFIFMTQVFFQIAQGRGSALALFTGIGIGVLYFSIKYEKRMRKIRTHSKAYVEGLEIIRKFKPSFFYPYEDPYQQELYRELAYKLPGVKVEMEKAFGSSRADIALNERIGIEVKGPTKVKDLQTIADKCLRYSQHFDHVILVLFNTQMIERRYNEWLKGINAHYPDIEVIRIDGLAKTPSEYYKQWSVEQSKRLEKDSPTPKQGRREWVSKTRTWTPR